MDTKKTEESIFFEEESKDHLNSTFFNSEKTSLNTNEMSDINLDIEKKEDMIFNEGKVYGVNVKSLKPSRLGKVFAMLYFKKNPLIIIGPDCKIFNNRVRSTCILLIYIRERSLCSIKVLCLSSVA